MTQVYGLRWVPRATIRPHRCAVVAHIGSSRKGFFDTGTDYGRDRVYVSVDAVELMASSLGWLSPSQAKASEERTRVLERQVEDLRRELEIADSELNAVEVIRRRRPSKAKEAA